MDIKIINNLSDKELINICLVNKYAYNLCNNDNLWLRRFMQRYGKYFSVEEILKWKADNSWKNYYLWLSSNINDEFPYYISAKATELGREDILKLLPPIRGIKNVKEVIANYPSGQIETKYYIRVGDIPMKEGRALQWFENGILDADVEWKSGKINGYFKRYFDNGQLQYYSASAKYGLMNGLSSKYFRNGNIWITGITKMGNMHGEWKEYYETGELSGVANFVDDSLDGIKTMYYKYGKVKRVEEYINRVIVESKDYDTEGNLVVQMK